MNWLSNLLSGSNQVICTNGGVIMSGNYGIGSTITINGHQQGPNKVIEETRKLSFSRAASLGGSIRLDFSTFNGEVLIEPMTFVPDDSDSMFIAEAVVTLYKPESGPSPIIEEINERDCFEVRVRDPGNRGFVYGKFGGNIAVFVNPKATSRTMLILGNTNGRIRVKGGLDFESIISKTSNGKIVVNANCEAEGSLNLHTSNGGINFETEKLPLKFQLRTSNGSVHATIPGPTRGQCLKFQLQTSNGKVSAGMNYRSIGRESKTSIHGMCGAESGTGITEHEAILSTSNGNVRLISKQ